MKIKIWFQYIIKNCVLCVLCVEYDYLVGYIRDSLLTKQIIKLKNYEERSYSEEGSS